MGGSISGAQELQSLQRKASVVKCSDVTGGIAVKSRIFKKSITDDYSFSSKVVGTGFSGPVRLATHKQTSKECAIKRYDKNAADFERIKYLKSEAEVYLRLDHPNICKLFAIYEDERNVWIVMEYCAGKELSQRLHERKVYSEIDAAEVTRQMVEAVHYLHSNHVVHRDLKLENWLYEKSVCDDGGRLKLIDFGFSKIWHPKRSQKMDASCGSLTYVSPDTLSGSYTNACDMWSLGVTVYFLLVGVPPFFGTEKVIVDRIRRGAYSMDGARWARISNEGQDFVRRLLVVDPVERMSSREALDHPWIVNCRQQTLSPQPLEQSVLHSLRQFALASRMKRAALTMMAYSLTTKDIEELTSLFQQFDRNQDGCISLSDFMEVMKANFNISNIEIENLFNAMSSMPATSSIVDDPENKVCYSDFIAALLQTRLRFHEDAIREAFWKFDADRSGYITADDLRQVIGEQFEGVNVNEVVKTADSNSDGKIDYEEFLAAVLAEVHEDEIMTTPTAIPVAVEGESQQMIEVEKPIATTPDERAERKRRFLRQLLGVVDSNLAEREAYGGLKIITKSRSSPHILTDVFGDYSSDPRTPHARPWDCRLEPTFNGTLSPINLPGIFHDTKENNNITKPLMDFNELNVKPRRSNGAGENILKQLWSVGSPGSMDCKDSETERFLNSVKERLLTRKASAPNQKKSALAMNRFMPKDFHLPADEIGEPLQRMILDSANLLNNQREELGTRPGGRVWELDRLIDQDCNRLQRRYSAPACKSRGKGDPADEARSNTKLPQLDHSPYYLSFQVDTLRSKIGPASSDLDFPSIPHHSVVLSELKSYSVGKFSSGEIRLLDRNSSIAQQTPNRHPSVIVHRTSVQSTDRNDPSTLYFNFDLII